MSYRLEFLDDEAFNKLPATDIYMRAGVAYPEHQIAFVRNTGVPAIDVLTGMHELSHLHGESHDEHYDAENKCYYKNLGQTVAMAAPLAMLIPGVGPAVWGAMNTIGAGVSGALGAIPGIGGALSGASQAAGGAINSIGGALGMGGGAGKAGLSTEEMLQAPLEQNLANQAGIGGISGMGAAASGGLGAGLSQFGKSAGQAFAGNLGQNALSGLMGGGNGGNFGGGNMYPQGFGQESISSPQGSNVIAGQSGTGSGGGAGAAPGGGGGSLVPKLKSYLAERDSSSQSSPVQGGLK